MPAPLVTQKYNPPSPDAKETACIACRCYDVVCVLLGTGESEPSAFFYQNLAEAEYVVATYMYMRILGYPADKITILTTYNGQKHLIRDVINARCASNPLLGKPRHITTVDRFQVGWHFISATSQTAPPSIA